MRTSAVSSQFHSQVPSRIVPITVSNRAQQSPVSRRDMIAFTKAAQAAAKPNVSSLATKREIDVGIKRKEVSQLSSKSLADHSLPRIGNTSSSPTLQTAQPKPVKVVSPTISKREATVEESHQKESKRMESRQDTYQTKTTTKEENQHVKVKESIAKDEKDLKGQQRDVRETDRAKATMKEETHHIQMKEFKGKDERESENVEPKVFVGKEKVLDAVSMEDIIQQVMKPAGLDPKVCSSPDSRITYHVEKTEQEDGTTKTQIVLQSKVEEELDLVEDSALEEFLTKEVKKITLENIKGTPTGKMIQNLLSLGLEGESMENRTVNVEIIEEPVESESDEGEIEIGETMEMKSKPKIKPSSMFFQIEELESDTKPHREKPEMKVENSSLKVQEVTREETLPYFSHGQESQEYFVSTPEENMSESEEGGRFMSYSHYGVVDDLSDERYYQEEELKMPTAEGHSYRDSPEYDDHSFSIPECIEEEVHVSPTLQQSIVGILREESLSPEQQLRGAIEQIQETVSGALKEELAFFTKGRETPENVSVDITNNGTMTIVAELNVSQTLEESGLLEEQEDPSEDQIMAALSSAHPSLQQALSAGAGKGYTMKVSREEIQTEGVPWMTSEEEIRSWSPTDEVSKTEKHIKLGPTERSFTFKMDVNNGSSASASGGVSEAQSQRGTSEFLQTQMIDPHLKVCHEKRIATVYLESPKDD